MREDVGFEDAVPDAIAQIKTPLRLLDGFMKTACVVEYQRFDVKHVTQLLFVRARGLGVFEELSRYVPATLRVPFIRQSRA